jgi:HSP20 family protein
MRTSICLTPARGIVRPSAAPSTPDSAASTEAPTRTVAPATDILENDHGYRLVADLPGVAPDRLQLDAEEGRLTIIGTPAALPEGRALRAPTGSWVYRRTFTLPRTIDLSRITAQLSQGVLTVDLPRHEATQARRIPVVAN